MKFAFANGFVFIVAGLALNCSPVFASSYSAEVTHVSDGDTICVMHGKNEEKLRLNGIDCPEIHQAFGNQATDFTKNACLHKIVQVESFNQDKYGRTIADVTLPDGKVLNNELVRAGLAWWYEQYAPDNKTLSRLEVAARAARTGLWIDSTCMPPWEFRHPEMRVTRPLEGRLSQLSSGINQQDEMSRHDENNSRAPLEGTVKTAAPLQGGVDRADVSFQHGQPALDQSRRPLLQANANGSATIMRIVQTKFNFDAPQAAPVPARPLPPVSDGVPVRSSTFDNNPPVRSGGTDQPPLRKTYNQPESRSSMNEPPRSSSEPAGQPPLRGGSFGDGPPVRVAGGDAPPPPRVIAMDPPPPVYVPPKQISFTPPPVVSDAPGRPHERRREREQTRPKLANPKNERSKNTQMQLSSPPLQKPSATEEMLMWEPWYRLVNELVCGALTKTMPANGNPAGSNRIQVTVLANHELSAAIVQQSNPDFDNAILSAYSSLNHNPRLAFPNGTQRRQVQYEIAHTQDIPAPTAGFDSRTIHNDVEILK